MGRETIFYLNEKWVYKNFAIIAKLWQSKNFAGYCENFAMP